jgi:outer membrane protein assembly factor BamB
MFEISRCRQVFWACLFVLCFGGVGSGAQEGGRWLISPELLKSAKLKIVWDDELPIKKGEKLERLSIVGERVYALSSRNFEISLDKDKGGTVFSKYASPAGLPLGEPVLYKDELISALGSKLVEMSERSGEELRATYIDFGIVCPAVRNSSFFYISGADRRLHVLREKDLVQLFEATADNDSMITSVMADEDSVIFGTDAGNVVCMSADKALRLWQFDVAGAVVGRIVRDGMSLYFASKDMNVYRVDIVDRSVRRLVWKHQVEGVPEVPPRVTKEVVYQYVRSKGLTAIVKERGQRLWNLAEGVELLAEAGGRAYVITNAGTLTVMDNMAGKKLYSVNFRQASRYAANTVDSKIYVADEIGRIACLQPVEGE